MPKIPRSEPSVDFKPAMQPFSTGDGYEAPGRGLQKIGQGIQSLGGAFAGLGEAMEADELHRAKLKALNVSNEHDLDDMRARSTFNPDTDNIDEYAANRSTALENRLARAREGISSQRAQQYFDLYSARYRGTVNERNTGYQIGLRQQRTFNETSNSVTAAFDDLNRFLPTQPSPDAENQAGYAGADAPPATPNPDDQILSRIETTLRAVEGIIQSMPGSPDLKERLYSHAEQQAFAAFGSRKDAWPSLEQWRDRVRQRSGAQQGTPQAPSSRTGAPVDYLKSRLAPGAEGRVSDVTNLHPVKQDRLAAFIAAAEDAGHDIRILSGHRDASRQAVLWRNALAKYGSAAEARKHVAPPGGSTHQSGEAVDLVYMDRGRGLGGQRTAAVEWAHANAKKFGLAFPLGHEDWHIETTEARAGGKRYGGSYAQGGTLWKAAPSTAPQASAVSQHITAAASRVGMEPGFLAQIAHIESSSNPNKRTGSYAGLFQMSEADFKKYGGTGSITDPEQNALAAANKFADLNKKFVDKFKRDPTAGELYLMHQQGEGGASAHFTNPDRPAWQSMASTAEGRQKGEEWAKRTIWGNLTAEAKKQFGSVENVTSRQFVDYWSSRVEGPGSAPSEAPTRVASLGGGGAAPSARATNTIPGSGPQVAQAPSRGMSPLESRLIERINKAEPAMREAYTRQVEQNVAKVEEMAAKGQEITDAEMNRLLAMVNATGNGPLMQRIEMMAKVIKGARETNQANEAELSAIIQGFDQKAASGQISMAESAARDHYKKKRDELKSALDSNPYEWGNRVGLVPGGVMPIRPDSAPDELRAALEARVAVREALGNRTRRDLPYLQPKEIQEFTEFMGVGKAPIDVKLGILRTMHDSLGPGMVTAMKEIAKDAPELASIGWLMSQNADPMAMKDAMRGIEMRRTEGFKSRFPDNDDTQKKIDVLLGAGSGTFSEIPQARQYAQLVASLIYEARADRRGIDPTIKTVNDDLLKEATLEAIGQNKSPDGKTLYGGVGMVGTTLGMGGYKAFVPPWVKQDGGLSEIMSKLRMADFARVSLQPGDRAMASAAAAGREGVDDETTKRVLPTWEVNEDEKARGPNTMPKDVADKITKFAETNAAILNNRPDPKNYKSVEEYEKAQQQYEKVSKEFREMYQKPVSFPVIETEALRDKTPPAAVYLPVTASGKPVSMADIRGAQLVWIGGSRYWLRTGYDGSRNPTYIYGRTLDPITNQYIAAAPYVVDLERFRPLLENRVEKDTFRGLKK